MSRSVWRSVVFGVFAASILVACGSTPGGTTQGALSGAVVVGSTYTGKVIVYDLRPDGGVIGESTRVNTGDGGEFSIDLPAAARGPVLLVASGGTFVDLATDGGASALTDGVNSGINMLLTYQPGAKLSGLAITPFSTLHAAVTRKLVGVDGRDLKSAGDFAREKFQKLFSGVDMLTLPYSNLTSSSSLADSRQATVRGIFLSGLSQMSKDIAERAGQSLGPSVDVSALAVALVNDYESNGIFDGLTKTEDATSRISIPSAASADASTPLAPDTLRYKLSFYSQAFLRGPQNVLLISADNYPEVAQIVNVKDDVLFGDKDGGAGDSPLAGMVEQSDYFEDTDIDVARVQPGVQGSAPRQPIEFVFKNAVSKVQNGSVVHRFSSLLEYSSTPDRKVWLRVSYGTSVGTPFTEVIVKLASVDGVPYSGDLVALTRGRARRTTEVDRLVYEYNLPNGTPYGDLVFTWTARLASGASSDTSYNIKLVPPKPPVVFVYDKTYADKSKQAGDESSFWGPIETYNSGRRLIHYEVYNPLNEPVVVSVGNFVSAPGKDVSSIIETWTTSNDYDAPENGPPQCWAQSYYQPYYESKEYVYVGKNPTEYRWNAGTSFFPLHYLKQEYSNEYICDDTAVTVEASRDCYDRVGSATDTRRRKCQITCWQEPDAPPYRRLGAYALYYYDHIDKKIPFSPKGLAGGPSNGQNLPPWSTPPYGEYRGVCKKDIDLWFPCGITMDKRGTPTSGPPRRPIIPADEASNIGKGNCVDENWRDRNVSCIRATNDDVDPFGHEVPGSTTKRTLRFKRQVQSSTGPETWGWTATAYLNNTTQLSVSSTGEFTMPALSERGTDKVDVYLSSTIKRETFGLVADEWDSSYKLPAPTLRSGDSTSKIPIAYTYDTLGCLRYKDDPKTGAKAKCTSTGAEIISYPYKWGWWVWGGCPADQTWTAAKWQGYRVYGKLEGVSFFVNVNATFNAKAGREGFYGDPKVETTNIPAGIAAIGTP